MTTDQRESFRCTLLDERTVGFLKVGRVPVQVEVVDLSRDGYRLKVKNSLASQLEKLNQFTLQHERVISTVEFVTSTQIDSKESYVGVRRLSDSLGSLTGKRGNKSLPLAVLLSLFVVVLWIPGGLGERLGLVEPTTRNDIAKAWQALFPSQELASDIQVNE